MIWQLRTYRIRPGCMDQFRELWNGHIVPLRESLGFEVAGGWFDEDDGLFVWLVGHPAPDGWAAAEQSYYSDPGRSSLPRDPRDFVSEVETRLMQAA
jgi:hypothetical protein